MTIKETLAELRRDVVNLRAELGSRAGNVGQTDTTKTIREQVHSFEAERAALLEIEGNQPAVIAFAVDDTGKPIKPKLTPAMLTTCGKPVSIKSGPDIAGAPAVEVDGYAPKLTREQAEKELARLQKLDPKKTREYFLKHKKLLTGGVW